ncbi:MAG TPA: glycosyltransferase family 39 protein [Acidimicrobiales bacterium]|nr:glycosyltransferase family 39 protein [Acidimicrobiales bacterium]
MASPIRPVPEAVILGTALVLRVVWLVATRHLILVNDPADYQRLAVSIAAGHGFGRTVVAPGGGPTAFRPPLWPLFLAGLYWLVGVHVTVARAVEVVLGTLSVGLVGVLAAQLWSRGPARVAMGLAAVYPPLLLAGGSLLSESLSLPLELGTLAAALAARRSPRPARWILACGVGCGLDILCRPDSFVLLVPVCLLVAVPWMSPGRAAPAVVVVLAGLTVTPWLIRDAVVMHHFVPVTTQGGLVASGTYNATSAEDPLHPAEWRPADLVPGYLPLLRGDEVTEEAALRRASLHYIAEHPLYPLRASGWNLLRLFDLTGLSDPRASWAANGYGPGLADLDAVGLAGVVLLGLIGVSSSLGRSSRGEGAWPSRPGTWPVWLAPFLLAAVTVPVLGESRLRVGIDPFLILAAVPGVWAVGQAFTRRRVAAR